MKLDPLFSKEQIQEKLQELAKQINEHYGSSELVVIGILRGAFVFYSDLVKHLKQNIICDFCSVSFYKGNKKASSAVNLNLDVRIPVEGRQVLIIDCIADHGYSLNFVKGCLEAKAPKSIKTACLIVKPQALKNSQIDFKGFEVPQDCFVVGYGIDYKNQGRSLDHFAHLIELN